MRTSQKGLALIKAFEGCLAPAGAGHFKPYVCPAGVLTIGWGHTNHHGRRFDRSTIWTQRECDLALAEDLASFERDVERLVKVPLKQHQFDALVSFAYNCGTGNLAKSTLLKKVNAKDFDGAAREFGKWNKGAGRVLNGLVRRRACEALVFQGLADTNFDGRPDKIAPRAKPAEIEPMPQQVDPPQTKPMSKSTIGNGAAAGGGLGLAALVTFVLEKMNELPDSVTAALVAAAQKPTFWLVLGVVGACGYVWWRRRVKLKEEGA